MFNKKYLLTVLLFVLAIGAITGVCAGNVNETNSDMVAAVDNINTTDEIAVTNYDDSDETGVSDSNISNDASVLEADNSEVLSDKNVTSILYISHSGTHLADKVIKVKLTDLNGNPQANKEIWIEIFTQGYVSSNAPHSIFEILKTNANGIVTYKWNSTSLPAGTYTVVARDWAFSFVAEEVSLENIKVVKKTLKIIPAKLVTTYASGKLFKLRVVDISGNGVNGVKLKLRIYTGNKVIKTLYVTTNAKGYATYSASKLPGGYHNVVISYTKTDYAIKSVKSAIKINKKAFIVGTKSRSGDSWAQVVISVRDGATKKLMNGIKVIVKVYTGKKYKAFSLVTGKENVIYKSNGLAIFESNKFSIGKHKVTVSVSSPYYKGSKAAVMKIPAGAKNAKKYTFVVSYGYGNYI